MTKITIVLRVVNIDKTMALDLDIQFACHKCEHACCEVIENLFEIFANPEMVISSKDILEFVARNL